MLKGSVSFIELHVEKLVLGLAGLLLLASVFLFLVRTPNVIEYGGQKVAPGELDEAVRREAEGLKRAIDTLKPPAVSVPDYSGQLEQRQAGIDAGGAAGASALAVGLPLSGEFGKPIPKLGDDEDLGGEVAIVTPLRPSAPAVRTGRSEVIRKTKPIGSAAPTAVAEGAEGEDAAAVELPWVSVAAYFSRKAQQQEMTKAGYAPYKTKVYFTGVDVERQEMLSSGEWTDWQPVTNSKATPKLDVPDPQFRPATGDIENNAAITDAFNQVQSFQKGLVQPDFYEVRAGDFWQYPPLEGYEDDEEEDEAKVAEAKAKEREERMAKEREEKKSRAAAARPSGPPSAGPRPMGGGGGEGVAGGGMMPRMHGPVAPVQRDNSAAKEKKDAQERGKKDFADARAAFARKDYVSAEQAARRVIDNKEARGGDRSGAQKILKAAEKSLARQQRSGGGGGMPVGPGSSAGVAGEFGRSAPAGEFGRSAPAGEFGGPRVAPMGGPAGMGPRPAAMGGSDATAALDVHPDDRKQSPGQDRVVLCFHDDTVEAGKTYRYRMRAKLWNRYVGKLTAVKNPELAKHTVLVGEWSLPSDAVTVTPSTYFFAAGPSTDKTGARVEVWKWHKGNWVKESFEVGVGDVIGGTKKAKTGEFNEDAKEIREDIDFTTGAIVLDVRPEEPIQTRVAAGKEGQFNLREVKSLVLVYLDPADGQVKQRVQALDKFDPIYKKLKEEL